MTKENEEAVFNYSSAERIARTVKEYERSSDASNSRSKSGNNSPTNIDKLIEVTGVYNSGRKMYPGRFIYATLNGSNQLVWNFLTSASQDCWIDANGQNLSYAKPSRVKCQLVVIGSGELPVYYYTPSGEGFPGGVVTDVTCVGGELAVTKTG